MEQTYEANEDQAVRWNGTAGRAWVELQEQLDQMFAPFERLLADAAQACGARAVLDVGCGTGATTLAIARRLGAGTACTGIDISRPMIELARTRAAQETVPARFIEADAQTWPFPPASFDLIVSRLGVMFFDDPVRAFGNLRRAAADGAALRFIAWRGPEENPFMTTAERSAAPLLPALPPRRPNEPGQFAFADPRRIAAILEQGGWSAIEIEPVDVEGALPERELIRYVTMLGPVGLILRNESEENRARIVTAMRAAFQPFVHGSEVRFTSAGWMVGARAA